jgi:hypothetical protein
MPSRGILSGPIAVDAGYISRHRAVMIGRASSQSSSFMTRQNQLSSLLPPTVLLVVGVVLLATLARDNLRIPTFAAWKQELAQIGSGTKPADVARLTGVANSSTELVDAQHRTNQGTVEQISHLATILVLVGAFQFGAVYAIRRRARSRDAARGVQWN